MTAIILMIVFELLIEVAQYTATGKHNWLAIGYATVFSITAITIVCFDYYYNRKK